MEPGELSARRAVVAACRSLAPARLSQGTSGNVSVRWGDGCLVSPSALPAAGMRPVDVVRLGPHGERTAHERPPSSEWRFHVRILASRPEAGAVVHVHSPAATALASLRLPIPGFHYMVAKAGGVDVRCTGYAAFGTEELADLALAGLEGRDAVLLANHGQIAVGADLDGAMALAVDVEALAEQYLLARSVGEPVRLSDDELADALARFGRYRRGTLDEPDGDPRPDPAGRWRPDPAAGPAPDRP